MDDVLLKQLLAENPMSGTMLQLLVYSRLLKRVGIEETQAKSMRLQEKKELECEIQRFEGMPSQPGDQRFQQLNQELTAEQKSLDSAKNRLSDKKDEITERKDCLKTLEKECKGIEDNCNKLREAIKKQEQTKRDTDELRKRVEQLQQEASQEQGATLKRYEFLCQNREKIQKAKEDLAAVEQFLKEIWDKIVAKRRNDELLMEKP